MNIFTNNDYRKIQAWLKANAIKDSEFAISENTVPDKDILVITQNMSTVPTNYKIKIKDLLNSSLGKVVIDKITANIVKVNNSLTVDASKVILNNEKGTTLQEVLNYFEENKLNRHTDDIFDGNLTVKKNITIEGNIKSNDDTITVEADLEATGEITDGHGNLLNDVNSAAKQWSLEYQDPQQDEPTVRAKYVLKDYRGVPKGSVIKIYKDSAITNVYLGTIEDTCNPNTGEVTKHPIHDNNEALSIVYRLDTGKYSLVNVPIKMFTTEAEFDKYRGLGVTSNGQVFIKLASDVESSNYLHFNELGEITADGIENRILRDLGNIITSVAGDRTMWGVYKEHEGTQETSTPNDGSRWGEFKRAEEIREGASNSAHQVFADNWDAQDDDPELPQDKEVVDEASYAYNWKSTDSTRQGNLGDLAEEFNGLSTEVSKLENEVIYDVTANNNGAIFASLSELLLSDDLSILIPTSVRHGGMTIRFIKDSEQSSDNKYVQYLLTKNQWSVNEADWEKMNLEEELEGKADKKYILGGHINVSPESIISAQISDSVNNELIAVPTNKTAKIAFFPILKGHKYTITIPRPYTWQFNYGYCDEILVTDPTENTNLGGIINGYSYITSSNTITIEVYSELDGYYFVGFNGTGGNPSVIDNIIGTDNVCSGLQIAQDVIKDEIIVNNRIPLSLSYRDDIILQTEKVLTNANMRTFYVSAKTGDKFSIVSFSNSSIFTGFTELLPEVKMGVTDYSAANDYVFYGQEIISHINGYFCISIDKSKVSPSVYKINNKIGKDVYENSHKIDVLRNSLQNPTLKTIQTQVIDGFATPLNAVIGNSIVLSTNSNRKTLKLDIENLNGSISATVYGVSDANNCICIVNRDDLIIGYVDVNYKSWYTQTFVDLDAYKGAKYMYITSGSNYNSVIHINNSLSNPKSFSDIGSIVLHFDGSEIEVNGTLYSRRKQIVDSYGWKASFCIGLDILNDAGTDWRNNAVKEEYWSLIKDGWTPMLYPAASAISRTEEQWNAWIDNTLAKFANVGVYNITTFACGNLAINEALLNACIKHNFKIIRGGGVGSDNTYVYKPDNFNCIQIQGNKKNYVLAAKMMGGDSSTVSPTDLDVIHGAMQMRGARAIFSHVALKELPAEDKVNVSEAYLIKVLDYIKSLENQGKIQVMNMDDLYNNLNPSDSITWNNNRTIKMFNT